MARRFTGFLWILFFVAVGAAFYLGFLFGFDQGRSDAAVATAMRKPAEEEQPPPAAVPHALAISAGESYFSLELNPGGSAALDLSFLNDGMDVFTDIELSAVLPGEGWSAEFSEDAFEKIDPGEAVELTVTLIAPQDVEPGDYEISVRAEAKAGGKVLFRSGRTVSIRIVG